MVLIYKYDQLLQNTEWEVHFESGNKVCNRIKYMVQYTEYMKQNQSNLYRCVDGNERPLEMNGSADCTETHISHICYSSYSIQWIRYKEKRTIIVDRRRDGMYTEEPRRGLRSSAFGFSTSMLCNLCNCGK